MMDDEGVMGFLTQSVPCVHLDTFLQPRDPSGIVRMAGFLLSL